MSTLSQSHSLVKALLMLLRVMSNHFCRAATSNGISWVANGVVTLYCGSLMRFRSTLFRAGTIEITHVSMTNFFMSIMFITEFTSLIHFIQNIE